MRLRPPDPGPLGLLSLEETVACMHPGPQAAAHAGSRAPARAHACACPSIAHASAALLMAVAQGIIPLITQHRLNMFAEYIEAALERAVYKTIEDEDPIFVSVPELQGAWATGKTIEEARKELISVIEGWIALRLRMGRSIPPIGGHLITASIEPVSAIE
jgi:predicted RNase H-like HicB family nuclease